MTNVSIVDWLTVPKATPAGDYVLQLRYDCEESAQICTCPLCLVCSCACHMCKPAIALSAGTNCADLHINAA